jgi:hypothetical protein
MVIVLRAASEFLDVDQCLQWIPGDLLEVVWRRGDRSNGHAAETTSGFNLTLADEDHPSALEAATAHLLRMKAPLQSLVQSGETLELDVGLEVGAIAPKSITMPADMVRVIAAIGITLRVTAYPCSDAE